MTHTADLENLLAPLLDVMERGAYLRLVARPGRVDGDRAEGSTTIDVAWSAAQHADALAQVQANTRLSHGGTVNAYGDLLVLVRPPDVLWRLDDWVRQGWLSSLAARTLSAAASVGRNILITGPWAQGVQLCASIAAEGRRPALLGTARDAVPAAWPLFAAPEDVRHYGADRTAAWSLSAGEVAAAMGRQSGLVAWIDAGRLDRALVRFEAGIGSFAAGQPAPLHVLAGLDLVVIATHAGGPRLREIAEIILVADGYRPNLLFASGMAPAPSALVPVAVPSFVDELAQAGHSILADDLRHAAGTARPAAPVGRQSIEVAEPALAPRSSPAAATRAAPRPPQAMEAAGPPTVIDSEPGWELDKMLTDDFPEGLPAAGTVEEATLAATLGLGPPPRPGFVKAGPATDFTQVLANMQTAGENTEAGNDDET